MGWKHIRNLSKPFHFLSPRPTPKFLEIISSSDVSVHVCQAYDYAYKLMGWKHIRNPEEGGHDVTL